MIQTLLRTLRFWLLRSLYVDFEWTSWCLLCAGMAMTCSNHIYHPIIFCGFFLILFFLLSLYGRWLGYLNKVSLEFLSTVGCNRNTFTLDSSIFCKQRRISQTSCWIACYFFTSTLLPPIPIDKVNIKKSQMTNCRWNIFYDWSKFESSANYKRG